MEWSTCYATRALPPGSGVTGERAGSRVHELQNWAPRLRRREMERCMNDESESQGGPLLMPRASWFFILLR